MPTPDAPPSPAPTASQGGLGSRTFVGLLVAQFFAAFNDQAIHAAAMFFAINRHALSERTAISLMPILFYTPWAIFCTVAGYLADKYSKRTALVSWKFAEVGITAVAAVGFWLGRSQLGIAPAGPWVVLACVFLMGVHSCFFVPAKYGVMPEILPPHLLSKGNGLLESLSFLAVILGTVCGGVLSYLFLGDEVVVGLVLLALAVVGAVASLLIRKMPAAAPDRPFPRLVYAPLFDMVKGMLAARPLRVALLGIAFFTFVVAFMRAAVYMLGESQNPRWDELKTSVVVGTVALGIGLGSPLAGFLSGKRVNLRLVVGGAVGMIALLVAAGAFIQNTGVLVGCTVGIGFCTGFYIVPLFTLLQLKAPKSSKGEMVATSNLVNVTGAIASSLLFFGVVVASQAGGLAPPVADHDTLGSGTLAELKLQRGRPVYFEVVQPDDRRVTPGEEPGPLRKLTLQQVVDDITGKSKAEDVIDVAKGVEKGAAVTVTRYDLAGVTHYDVVPEGQPPPREYDNRKLPRFLFLGAAALTLIILLVLAKPMHHVQKELDAEGKGSPVP